MLLLALISQPLYALGLNHTTAGDGRHAVWSGIPMRARSPGTSMSWNRPSIMLSLLAGMLLIWCFKDKSTRWRRCLRR